MQINNEVFFKLILPFWVCVARHAQGTQNKKFACLCIISRKMGMKLIICLQINMKCFYKLIVSLWVYLARHGRKSQNNKFAISLQYIKESVMDEVDFFPADNTSILGVCDQACPNYSK